MASGRTRQMAQPICSMRFRFPNPWTKNNARIKKPFWQQKLREGKFYLPDRLRDSPDWTYRDGRPAPLNQEQLETKFHQIYLAKEIVRGLKEISDAEKEHLDFLKQRREEYQAMELARPRAKGANYQKTKSKS